MPADDPNQIAREKSLSKVRSIYSELASLPIERNCQLRTECCQFHITGKTPFLTRGEALLAAKALKAERERQRVSKAQKTLFNLSR